MFLSLLYLLIAFIPVFLYVFIIWATTPWKSIKLKTSFQYLFTGLISIGIILTYFKLFPSCQDPIYLKDRAGSLLFFCFVQIALVEEISKLISFLIGERIRKEEREYDSPIGTMLYSGISALGFAFLENVNYAIQYGGEVLIARSIVSMMVHFLCGLILGYWISISRLPSKIETRSLFEIISRRSPKIRRVIYYMVGITCVVILHGLYDFSIFNGDNQTTSYMIIFGGIISAYLAAKNLLERSRF